jgi:hypothetical protein
MIKRIIIAAVAMSLVTLVAFGQMKYSRARSSQSPTPTPTPLPLIAPKEASVRSQPQPQRMVPTPTPSRQTFSQPQKIFATPTPSRPTFGQPPTAMQRPTPIPTPAKQAYLQSQRPNQKTAAALPSPQQTFRQAQVSLPAMTPAPIPVKPTPTPVPPPDIQAYLDKQLASSKDKKFHLNANGKDIALTPFHIWPQKSSGFNTTSTSVSMRSDEGRVYDIDFVTTGKDVTGIQVHRINGESVR